MIYHILLNKLNNLHSIMFKKELLYMKEKNVNFIVLYIGDLNMVIYYQLKEILLGLIIISNNFRKHGK